MSHMLRKAIIDLDKNGMSIEGIIRAVSIGFNYDLSYNKAKNIIREGF